MVWKSNFDSISRLGEAEKEPVEAGTERKSSQHALGNQTSTFGTRAHSPVHSSAPKIGSGVSRTHNNKPASTGSLGRSTTAANNEPPPIVNIGASIFAEQDLHDEDNVVPISRSTSPIRHTRNNTEDGRPQNTYSAPLEVRTMSEEVASTLQHIIRQVDVLTQTMSILEVQS